MVPLSKHGKPRKQAEHHMRVVKPGRGNSLVRVHIAIILSARAGSPARKTVTVTVGRLKRGGGASAQDRAAPTARRISHYSAQRRPPVGVPDDLRVPRGTTRTQPSRVGTVAEAPEARGAQNPPRRARREQRPLLNSRGAIGRGFDSGIGPANILGARPGTAPLRLGQTCSRQSASRTAPAGRRGLSPSKPLTEPLAHSKPGGATGVGGAGGRVAGAGAGAPSGPARSQRAEPGAPGRGVAPSTVK